MWLLVSVYVFGVNKKKWMWTNTIHKTLLVYPLKAVHWRSLFQILSNTFIDLLAWASKFWTILGLTRNLNFTWQKLECFTILCETKFTIRIFFANRNVNRHTQTASHLNKSVKRTKQNKTKRKEIKNEWNKQKITLFSILFVREWFEC